MYRKVGLADCGNDFSNTFFHKRFFFYIHYSKNARPFAPRPLTDGFFKKECARP